MTDQEVIFSRTPWEMARASKRVAYARDLVLNSVLMIEDECLRAHVSAMLVAMGCEDPRIEHCSRVGGVADHLLLLSDPRVGPPETAGQELALAKLARNLPYDPTWGAPGANLSSHHCYPGGWALHTALNVEALLQLIDQAQRIKQASCDKDALIAAMILHDWAKLKLMTWNEAHELDAEQGVGHHIVVLAEGMLRDLPPRMISYMAGVHSGWWVRPNGVRNAIERAAKWASVDPVAKGYLDPERDELSLETWIVHRAEGCWGLAKPAIQSLEGRLAEWYAHAGWPYEYSRFRNAMYTAVDELELLQALAYGSVTQLEGRFDSWVKGES